MNRIMVFLLALGLSFGLMTANALAVKQAFAKPCPMSQKSGEKHCPCCKDHCDTAMMTCAAKCAPQVSAHNAGIGLGDLDLRKSPPGISVPLMSDQFAQGPPSPVPIG